VTTAPASPTESATSRDLQLGLIGTGIAVTMWGLSGVIVKWIEMDALAIGFWRFFVYAILMCGWLTGRGSPPTWRVLRASLWGGLSLGIDIVCFFTAVKLTNIVNATTIGSLQPLVVAVFAAKLFGERIRLRNIIAALIAIAAVVVIVVESSGTPEWSGTGDLFAIGALFSWAAYFVFSKRSKGVITSTEYTAGTGVWTTLVAGGAGLIAGQDMSFPAASNWFPLLILVVGNGVIGHSVMNWSLVRIPLWLGSSLTLLIPVVSALAAWLFLDESLTVIQLLAMAVVVGALVSIVMSERNPEPITPPQAPLEHDLHPRLER
jgi:drug/metabolite transporter (DMT)-like permease